MILRPGIQTLLQDAQRQQFDVVLAEALDRISRDRADVESLRTPLLGKAEHLGARDQVTGAGLNRVSALNRPQRSDQGFIRPLATSRISRNKSQPASSIDISPVAIRPASKSIRSFQRRASSLRVATFITGAAARP